MKEDLLASRALTAVELGYWLDEFATRAAALVEVNSGQGAEASMMEQVSGHISALSRAWAVRDADFEPDPAGDLSEQWHHLNQIVYGAADAAMRIAKLLQDLNAADHAEAAAPVGAPATSVVERVAAALRDDSEGGPPPAGAENGGRGDE